MFLGLTENRCDMKGYGFKNTLIDPCCKQKNKKKHLLKMHGGQMR